MHTQQLRMRGRRLLSEDTRPRRIKASKTRMCTELREDISFVVIIVNSENVPSENSRQLFLGGIDVGDEVNKQ